MTTKRKRRTSRVPSVWDAWPADDRESPGKDFEAARREQTAAATNATAHGCSRIRPLYELEEKL